MADSVWNAGKYLRSNTRTFAITYLRIYNIIISATFVDSSTNADVLRSVQHITTDNKAKHVCLTAVQLNTESDAHVSHIHKWHSMHKKVGYVTNLIYIYKTGITISLHVTEAYRENRGEWSTWRPSRFNPGKNPGTHCSIGWVGATCGLNGFWKRQNLFPTRIRSPDRPARTKSL
jgi:hypothetical protein